MLNRTVLSDLISFSATKSLSGNLSRFSKQFFFQICLFLLFFRLCAEFKWPQCFRDFLQILFLILSESKHISQLIFPLYSGFFIISGIHLMLEAKFGTIPYFSWNLGDDPLLNRVRIAFVIGWVFWNRLKSGISKEDPYRIMYAFLPFLTSRILIG